MSSILKEVINELYDAARDTPRSDVERKFIEGLRDALELAVCDLAEVEAAISDPVERSMLASVAWRLLATGAQFGRFVDHRAIAALREKYQNLENARDAKSKKSAARRELLEAAIEALIDRDGNRVSAGEKYAMDNREFVLGKMGLPAGHDGYPSATVIKRAIGQAKQNRRSKSKA